MTIWLPVMGMAAAMAIYALFLYRHAINIPFADDILDILQFITGTVHSNGLMNGVDQLFAQHNDHRTTSSRLLYYLIYIVEGEVDFRVFTFMANMALPLLTVLLFLAVRGHPYRWWVLLPGVLVLFQLRAYGIVLWSMAAFAYFYVCLYGFASLFCLRAVSPLKFLAAIVFATLATFSLASGQVVWLVGLASLLHQTLILRRVSFLYPALWLVGASAVMVGWRIDLNTPNTMSTVLGFLVATPVHHITYFLTLLGNAVSESNVAIAATAGSVLLLGLTYSSLRNIAREDITLELFGWFIVLCVFAMVLGRAPYSELEYALSSRYSFPSILLLATVVILATSRIKARHKWFYSIPIIIATLYCLTSYQLYSKALQPEMEKRVQNFNRKNYWIFGKPKKESNPIVQEAIMLKIYSPPKRPYPMPEIAPSVKAPGKRK